MTTATTSQEPARSAYREIDPISLPALYTFRKITRFHALFHIGFFILGVIELFAFVLFFSFFTKSTILAFTLAGIFLTLFSYFILSFYLQAKKPEQFFNLKDGIISSVTESFSLESNTTEYHVAVAEGLDRFLQGLTGKESTYYQVPLSFETLSFLLQKFSIWVHWKDFHQSKRSSFLPSFPSTFSS